jgi:hypothetical protein
MQLEESLPEKIDLSNIDLMGFKISQNDNLTSEQKQALDSLCED